MSESSPTPPAELPVDFVDTLADCSPQQLRAVASYADELAEFKAREQPAVRSENATEEVPDEGPDGVPAKASITVKEINGNRYEYWQWREGDKIRSKYKGPADSDE